MKIFVIRDENDSSDKDLAYLFYYENSNQFYIELPENADPWETPILLSSFAKKGEKTVNSYWSKLWVSQRIVPSDRQNITQILRDNNLKGYDEYGLLMLSMGRCAQDDYYLKPIRENELPREITHRLEKRIEDVIPLSDFNLLVFFKNGVVKKCNLTSYFKDNSRFSVLLNKPELFSYLKIQIGGFGVEWDINLGISYLDLYKIGKALPVTSDDFKYFATQCIVNTAEAADILNCSRQYINELVKKDKLHPIKTNDKNTLFLKSEVLNKFWQ